jgi:hypothetical protein
MSMKLPHASHAMDSTHELLGSAIHPGASGLLVLLLAGFALVVAVASMAYFIAARWPARRSRLRLKGTADRECRHEID